MPFFQSPPTLGNQFTDDRSLRGYLERASCPTTCGGAIEPELAEMGELSGGRSSQLDRAPRHRAEARRSGTPGATASTPSRSRRSGSEAARVAAEKGVVATAYERKHGELSRIHQFALAYLFDASTDVYTCPLAMTDGAAKTLVVARQPRARRPRAAAPHEPRSARARGRAASG